jgi:eukaryotic-like serine/threonine-protein kinase
MTPAVFRFGGFEFRPADFSLIRAGERIKLSPKAFDVLRLLLERNGRLVEKDDLLRSVWPDAFVEEANLSVQVAAIRRALGRPPDGGEYIETVPKRGYRFAARVEHSSEALQGGGTTGEKTADASATAGYERPHARLVVLPLTILRSDPETDFLAFSLPDAIAAALAELPWLQVRSPHASLNRSDADDLVALAAATRGTHVLTGTLVRLGDIRVTLQLLELPNATVCWSQALTMSLDTLFEVEQDVTRRLCRVLATGSIGQQGAAPRASAPRNPAAYAFYLRANQLAYETSRWTEARELYRECLQADPDHAAAWAGLARCNRVIGKFASSEQEADDLLTDAERGFQRALALEPDLSVAHNLYAQLEVDLGRAPDAMRRLIARASRRPLDPQLFAGLVHALRFCGLLDESLAAHHRARELDPTVTTSVHHTWWMLREYERALGETYGDIGYMPGLALASLGRERDAVAALRWRERETRETSIRLLLASLRALLEGEREESLAALAQVIRSRLDGEALYYLARSYARLGESEQAVTLLDRSVAGGFVCHQAFVRDPWLAPLAGTGPFDEVLEQARQASATARTTYVGSGGPQLLE